MRQPPAKPLSPCRQPSPPGVARRLAQDSSGGSNERASCPPGLIVVESRQSGLLEKSVGTTNWRSGGAWRRSLERQAVGRQGADLAKIKRIHDGGCRSAGAGGYRRRDVQGEAAVGTRVIAGGGERVGLNRVARSRRIWLPPEPNQSPGTAKTRPLTARSTARCPRRAAGCSPCDARRSGARSAPSTTTPARCLRRRTSPAASASRRSARRAS